MIIKFVMQKQILYSLYRCLFWGLVVMLMGLFFLLFFLPPINITG